MCGIARLACAAEVNIVSWAKLFLPFICQWLFFHSAILCFRADSVLKTCTSMATVLCINSHTIKYQSHFRVRLSFRVILSSVNHTLRLQGQCWHVMLVAEIPEAHRAVISKGHNHYWLYQRLCDWCMHVHTHAPMHTHTRTCAVASNTASHATDTLTSSLMHTSTFQWIWIISCASRWCWV